MKKIYKLKKWYSLEDAAERLTLTLSEEVSVNDVLNLAIEGHIKLSWYMRLVYVQEVEYREKTINIRNFETRLVEPIIVKDWFTVESNRGITRFYGAYHLPRELCGVVYDYLLAQITVSGGDLISLNGFFVQDNSGRTWRVMERFDDEYIKTLKKDGVKDYYNEENYFPSGEWPNTSELGFTKEDIENFESYVQEKKPKELSTTERQTLYKIIIGMAKDGYGYDHNASRSPVPKQIQDALDEFGISVSDDTIRQKLKDASELLPQNLEA